MPLLLLLYILLIFIKFSETCLPTQNLDDVSTTTHIEAITTTTTAAITEVAYPCSICRKIYGDGCLGNGSADICATAAQVGLIYTLGKLTGYNYGDSNTCSTIFSCPFATTSKAKEYFTGIIIDGPAIVIATCSEVGTDAGIWYLGIPPLVTPIEIVSTTCENAF